MSTGVGLFQRGLSGPEHPEIFIPILLQDFARISSFRRPLWTLAEAETEEIVASIALTLLFTYLSHLKFNDLAKHVRAE